MTEKKKLPEPRASYNYGAVTEKDPSPLGNRGNGSGLRASNRAQQQQQRLEQRWHQEGGRRQRESIGTPVTLRRIVTVPQADPSYAGNTFVERQRLRRERAQARADNSRQTQYVARTLARTGTRASGGRVSVISRPLPSQPSPVPTRSGQQKPKRGRFWRFLSFFTVVTMLLVVGSFLLTGNVFRIEEVRVVGTSNENLIQRIESIGIKGQNIFLLDVSSLTTKIDELPEVETADLGKQLPNQLVVSIKERVPVLLWQTSNGTFGVDSEGMVVATADKTVGADHLSKVIDTPQQGQQANRGKSGTALRPGMRVNKTEVAFAVAVLKQLPIVNGESANSYKLYYSGTIYTSTNPTAGGGRDSSGSYTLENVVAGWRAHLGGADDANPLSNRLLELRSILDMARQHQLNIATIDVRYGSHPYYTLS
jgi:cell division septal protein FtsQ